jgi:hypothetical protein
MGSSESLCVGILLEFPNLAVANAKGHGPAVFEYATCALDPATGPTDDGDAINLRQKWAPFILPEKRIYQHSSFRGR